jgi:hypothetical protein
MSKALLDSLVAVGLGLALLLVTGVDKLLTHPTAVARANKPLRLAVSVTRKDVWDDMGKLLDTLGAGYKHQNVPMSDLYERKTYDKFDVLFLTCSSQGNDDPAVANNVRDFVARGGTLYASDWRYDIVARAFPDMASSRRTGEGREQQLTADVIDRGLQDALGSAKVPLDFNLAQWKPAAFSGDRVKILMKARYALMGEGNSEAPLLVKFGFGKGTVIFTSFHNEKQNSEIESKLLKYLVFSAVTAQIENEINLTMLEGGFSPQKSNLLSASGKSEFTNVYQSTKAGKVRFSLGFQEQGARLKLTVVNPEGKKREAEGTSTLVIEESAPSAGQWRYTVTALSVPYPDFPFTLTVGEAK